MMEINKEKLLLIAPKERYEQQLNDVRWKFKSDNIRIRDKHECRLCGAKKTQLDVHHIRYISGREAWDYDDGDLVTLCHSCHENLHKEETKAKLYWELLDSRYFYDTFFRGVGIIESISSQQIYFKGCWTELKSYQEDGHGRLWVEDYIPLDSDIRVATEEEIADFWEKVGRYYSDEYIIETFHRNIRMLLPKDHPIRIRARKAFKKAADLFEKQEKIIKDRFNYSLLVSKDNFAMFNNRRKEGYADWSVKENVLPSAYFLIASVKDVREKPQQDNSKEIEFDKLDLTEYRAATMEELHEWLDYLNHIESLPLFDENIDTSDLPF